MSFRYTPLLQKNSDTPPRNKPQERLEKRRSFIAAVKKLRTQPELQAFDEVAQAVLLELGALDPEEEKLDDPNSPVRPASGSG